MNLAESFANWLEDQSIATIGQDLYIGTAPSSNKAPDSIYWVTASGGDNILKLQTLGKVKSYSLEVRYRNRDYNMVYDRMQTLENTLNSAACITLQDFDTVEVEATTFPVDDDLDSEDRKVGLLLVTITTFKE